MSEGQLRSVQGVLRDAEWTLFALTDALLILCGKQALDGIANYARRKLGPVHAAALVAQQTEKQPQKRLLQSQKQQQEAAASVVPPARGAWLPWMAGMRLKAAGRIEESLSVLKPLLSPVETALAVEATQANFVSCHVTGCMAALGETESLRKWHELLSDYRKTAEATTAAPSKPNMATSCEQFDPPLSPECLEMLDVLHTPSSHTTIQSKLMRKSAVVSNTEVGGTIRTVTHWPWRYSSELANTERLDSRAKSSTLKRFQAQLHPIHLISDHLQLELGLGAEVPAMVLPTLIQIQAVDAFARQQLVPTSPSHRVHGRKLTTLRRC